MDWAGSEAAPALEGWGIGAGADLWRRGVKARRRETGTFLAFAALRQIESRAAPALEGTMGAESRRQPCGDAQPTESAPPHRLRKTAAIVPTP